MFKICIYISLIFTLNCSFGQSPGNVASNLQWWYKANQGTNTQVELSQIKSWQNFGGFVTKELVLSQATDPLFTFPHFKNQIINFNPALEFSKNYCAALQTAGSDTLNMGPLAGNNTSFIVFQSADNRATTNSLHYYSPYLFGTEASGTKYDFAVGFPEGKLAMKCDSNDIFSSYSSFQNNDNIAHIGCVSRAKGINELDKSFVNIILDGQTCANTFVVNTSYRLNSFSYPYSDYYHGLTVGAQIDKDQKIITNATCFDGLIAEIIVYNSVLKDLEVQKINSYLAIKYGITLNQSINDNYLKSDGSIIWNASEFGVYKHDITGIGIDNSSGLNQQKSKSINSNAILTVFNPSSLNANDFFVCSDNGLKLSATQSTFLDIKAPIQSRIEKVWRIQETGDVGTVSLSFDLSALPGNLNISDLKLILSKDEFLKNENVLINPTSLANKIVTFDLVNFDNLGEKYFTIGSINREQTPLSLEITSKPSLLVYEYISPGNDGSNDTFKILNVDYYPINELFIYNHEGIEIHHQLNFKNGDYDSKNMIDGFYYYVFKTSSIKLSGQIQVQH